MESFNSQLKEVVRHKRSWLCVGLDMNPEALGKTTLQVLKNIHSRLLMQQENLQLPINQTSHSLSAGALLVLHG